jgi:hypothetical protein
MAWVVGPYGCASVPRANDSEPFRGARSAEGPAPLVQVIIVALDGVRLQEVFEGIDAKLAAEEHLPVSVASANEVMPNLHRLARTRGVLLGGPGDAHPMWATGPNFVSLPGYRELLTGQAPVDCQKNECTPLQVETLADEFRTVSTRTGDVAVLSSWEGIEQTVAKRPDTVVSSCGRQRGTNLDLLAQDPVSAALLHSGREASPAPGTGEFRPDALTATIALRYLAREKPTFMFLGLGEPDEYAHQGDYAGYLRSLGTADRVLGELDDLLENTGAWQQGALVFVTTDHGRGNDFRNHGASLPESGRVWLLALGRRVASRGPAPPWHARYLADVAPTIRFLSGLTSDSVGRGAAPIASSSFVVAARIGYPLVR